MAITGTITERTTAEEQEDHQRDDHQRLQQGLHDVADGGIDVAGGVIADFPVQAGGQLGLDLREDLADDRPSP